MDATPIQATRERAKGGASHDRPHGEWGISIILTILFWVSVVIGFVAAVMEVGSFTGDPNESDLRWIVFLAFVGVVPALGRVSTCHRSQLGPITLTWTVVASWLLFLMDHGGLSIFGAMTGWWWWHYAIGGVLAVAPAGVAFFRARGDHRRMPFAVIAVIGLLFASLLAVTESSSIDRFARFTREVPTGTTLAELVEANPRMEFRVVDQAVTDASWSEEDGWSGRVEVLGGVQSFFEFEAGRLARLIVNLD